MTGACARLLVASLLSACVLAACSDPAREKVRHVEKGDAYVAEKKDQFAVIEYASAIKIDPKYGEAHWKLAQAYERMHNIRAAFPEFVRAADALPDDRTAQIKAIELLLLARQFENAKARAVALSTRDPKDVDGRLLQASAMAGLGDTNGAILEVEEAIKISPRDSKVYLNLGTVRMQMGQAKEAEAAFRRAIELNPASADTRLAFANFLSTDGRSPEAEVALTEALAKEPRHLLANQMLANLYSATGRIEQAEQPLKVIAEASTDSAPRFQLADYYVKVGRQKEATDLLTSMSTDSATFAEAEMRLASLEYLQRRTTEAHKRLDALLVRVPKNAPALAMKAQWLATENKVDEALDRAKAAVAADPQSVVAQETLARIQERRGENADAIKSYSEVLRLDPRAVSAQAALSRLNLAAGQPDAALKFAEEARRIGPASVPARVALSRTLLASGDLARAETEISALVTGAPGFPTGHALQGKLRATKHDFSGARKSFERALEISPGFTEAVVGLAALDLEAKNLPSAISRLEAEMVKQPGNAVLMAAAAQVYVASGDQAKAEQTLRRAVSVDPRFTAGYTMLAQMYLQQRRLDEARLEFEGIVKRDPAAVGPKTMIGVLLEAQGKRDEARKWYEGIVGGTDDAPVAANNLAFIYAEQGTNLDMALQLATSAKPKLPNDPNVDDTIGWVYYKKDLASLAVGPLEASHKGMPQNAEVLYHLGLVYAKLGDKAKARDALSRARAFDAKIGGAEAERVLASVSQ